MADLNALGIPQHSYGQLSARVDLHDGEICLLIAPDNPPLKGPAIGERDFDFVGLFNDMMVRQDETVWVDDDPRAHAATRGIASR
jgi:hypothetical protein